MINVILIVKNNIKPRLNLPVSAVNRIIQHGSAKSVGIKLGIGSWLAGYAEYIELRTSEIEVFKVVQVVLRCSAGGFIGRSLRRGLLSAGTQERCQ